MAFSGVGSNGGRGGRGRWRSQVGVLAEMNVVPLVDVVLVLLIIFMVTASVMEFGLNIDVPQVKQVRDTAEEHPVIGIARNGTTYLNDTAININNVGRAVKRMPRPHNGPENQVAHDTQSEVPQQPVKEEKAQKEPPPPKDAIPLKSRNAKQLRAKIEQPKRFKSFEEIDPNRIVARQAPAI